MYRAKVAFERLFSLYVLLSIGEVSTSMRALLQKDEELASDITTETASTLSAAISEATGLVRIPHLCNMTRKKDV